MDFILHEKRLLVAVDNPLFSGWAEATDHKILEGPPRFRWKGAKIPFAIWSEIVCFLRWTQTEFKEEALITLFYHPDTKKWAAWAFPQEPNGMTVKSLPDLPLFKEDRARFGAGWIQAGSVHHHCTAGAFASGTDTADETDRDGVHITLGNMDKDVLDTHIRQVFDGVTGGTHMLDWIDVPDFLKDAPNTLKFDFAIHAIKAVRGGKFPKEWETRIFKKVYPAISSFPNGNHHPTYDPRIDKQGAHSTILTRSTPTAGSETINEKKATASSPRKRGNASSANVGIVVAPSGNRAGDSWDDLCITALKSISSRLGVTIQEMWQLLAYTSNSMRSEEDIKVKEELLAQIKSRHIPELHAEKLLFHILQEEVSAHGVP